MWAFFLKLIFNKYTLGAIAALILFLAISSGISSIKSAYSERDRLHQQTIEQATEIEAISAQRNAQVAAANATSEALRNEIATRDRLATEAAARGAKLQKDLTNAQASIRKWRDQASAALTACLNTPLPDGMFPGGDKAAGTSQGNSGSPAG